MDINEYIEANLHLPEPLRTPSAQLQFTAFFYKTHNKESAYLFENVSLTDLTRYTFEIYFKEMFRHGYKLTPVRLKAGFTGLPLDTIVQRLIDNDYVQVAYRGPTSADYDKIVDGLVYSHNLDKYRKDCMYLPETLRDFHHQKTMFKMLHDKYKLTVGNLSWIGSHVFITDFIHHYLAYSGFVLRRARNNFAFHDLDAEIIAFETILRNKPFPLN
jgi:hypothetical protein